MGRSTETLSGTRYLFVPLVSNRVALGVFGIAIDKKGIANSERRLIDAWTGLASIALERSELAEAARKAEFLAESDKLHTALFNSVSHELRTPLATITGAVSTLLEKEIDYGAEVRYELLETIKEGAGRMERIVSNLLDTARLESGMMKLKSDWCDIEDVVGAALHRINDTVGRHVITTDLAADLPLLRADCVLLELVFVNLLDNALKYSDPDSEIKIIAQRERETIRVTVSDNGRGIPETETKRIFDKFYRVKQSKQMAGTGLGLSICKSIVEAHLGSIEAGCGIQGGLSVTFILPLNFDGADTICEAGESSV